MVAFTGTATELLLVLLAVWLSVGITLAVMMGRRGHNAFTWLFVGAFLGPLALPLALGAIRDERDARDRQLIEGTSRAGLVDILVGIDGSPESESALRTAVDLLGTRIGRMTLATALDLNQGTSSGSREEVFAEKQLADLASAMGALKPGTVLLAGQAAAALARYCTEQGFELLVVGSRGRGATKTVLGSTASRLAQGSGPPVLIVRP